MAVPPPRSRSRVRSSLRWLGALLLLALTGVGPADAWPPFIPPPGEPVPSAPTPSTTPEVIWWPTETPSDPWYPVGIVRLANEALILVERYRNRIFRFTDSSTGTGRLPAPDIPPVEWTAVSPAPGLSFYVLDGPGRRVQQYDFQGYYLGVALDLEAMARSAGLVGIDPAGLAVDRTGRAVITDRLGDRLLEFGPGWSFFGEWGQTGTGTGAWRRPGAVAVGRTPPFLVSDEGNARLVLVDEFGEPLAERRLPDVRGVAALESGFFAVSHGSQIDVVDHDLRTLETYSIPKSAGCQGEPFVTAALTGDATWIFVGDGCSGRVAQIRRTGR